MHCGPDRPNREIANLRPSGKGASDIHALVFPFWASVFMKNVCDEGLIFRLIGEGSFETA